MRNNLKRARLVLSVVAVLGAGLAIAAAPAQATDRDSDDTCGSAPPSGFGDVTQSNVHRRRIDCIKHYGITKGTTETTYSPGGTLIRGQLASFLARTLDAGQKPLPAPTTDWFDDDDGSVHEPAINRLAEARIVPTTSRTFGVGAVPTRAEMSRVTAAALAWAGALPSSPTPPDFFADDESSPDELSINLLADSGIVTGRAPGVFAPGDPLRRDQMATFLARTIDLLLDGPASHHHCRIRPPEARFDPFYTQQCDVFGIAVVGSSNVDPAALTATVDVVIGMLGQQPDVHARLATDGFYLILLGEEEQQTDPPEYARLRDDPDTDWDACCRGVADREYASAGEENVLCRTSDPYLGESILVHEFAHSILDGGLEPARPGFEARIQAAYDQAMAAGRWQNTYAASNHHEYWAEGVQSYFDANHEATPPDGIHNHVDTREELRQYDPALHDLVAEGVGGSWRYGCP